MEAENVLLRFREDYEKTALARFAGLDMTFQSCDDGVESYGFEAQSLVPGIANAIRAGTGTPSCALNLKRNEPLDNGSREPAAHAYGAHWLRIDWSCGARANRECGASIGAIAPGHW